MDLTDLLALGAVGRGESSDGSILSVDPDIMLDGCLIVGAKGSGKTTLVRGLIEEHLRLGCPVLAFDTTGDLTKRLQADLGLPVSRDLGAHDPGAAIRLRNVDIDDVAELFELPRIADLPRLVSALLGVLKYRVNRGTPEFALVESIVSQSWEAGAGVSLTQLVALVRSPPFQTLGVFDVDSVVSTERRSALAYSVLSLSETAEAWGSRPTRASSLESLLSSSQGAAATVLSFGQHSLSIRRFIVEVLLGMIEYRNPRMLLLLDEAAAFMPAVESTATSSMLLEAIAGGTDFSKVGVALVAEEPDDLNAAVADLCDTWIVGRMPSPRSRRQVVEALDLVNPPIDEIELDRTLTELAYGEHVLRSSRLESLKSFRSAPLPD